MTDDSRVIFETTAGASSRRYSRSQSDIWGGLHVRRAWLGTARCSDHLGKLEWPHLMYKQFYYQLELHWITVSCKGLRQNYHNWRLYRWFHGFFLWGFPLVGINFVFPKTETVDLDLVFGVQQKKCSKTFRRTGDGMGMSPKLWTSSVKMLVCASCPIYILYPQLDTDIYSFQM